MNKKSFMALSAAVWIFIAGNACAQPHKHRVKHHARHHAHVTHASYKEETLGNIKHSLSLASSAAVIFDETDGEELYGKNTENVVPIASITKLMTAMVVLDAALPMDEKLTISPEDVDNLRHSSSRLPVGTELKRKELLRLALMSSENRAASAIGHNYPGGIAAFVEQMNLKAKALGMTHSHFVDSSGLNGNNVSTASDLVKMVEAAYGYALIREFTTTPTHEILIPGHRNPLKFSNTNALVKNQNRGWQIGLSKTGYINEAGRCLVMQSTIAKKPVVIVLLDSWGKQTRIGDAVRIKKWMESRSASKQRFG